MADRHGTANGEGGTGRSHGAEVAALVAALRLGDGDVIGTLHAHGIRAETAAVLEWVPAVDVCWLDGADVAERHALCIQFGTDDVGTPEGVALLQSWLTTRPPPAFFEAGRRALRLRLALLEPADRGEVIDRVVARCEAAGRAAGAAFGVGSLSSDERQRIQQLRADLEEAR